MEEHKTDELREFTLNLSEKAADITNEIKKQNLMLESITHQAEENDKIFNRNMNIFADAMRILDKDKRNTVIVLLFITIVVLLYILRL